MLYIHVHVPIRLYTKYDYNNTCITCYYSRATNQTRATGKITEPHLISIGIRTHDDNHYTILSVVLDSSSQQLLVILL